MNAFKVTSSVLVGISSLFLLSCATTPQADPQDDYGNPYGVPQASGAQGEYPTTPSAQYPTTNTDSYPTVETPSYPSASSSASSGSGQSYTVQKGDTLWGISRKYNTTVGAIQNANGLSGSTIIAGQTLSIP